MTRIPLSSVPDNKGENHSVLLTPSQMFLSLVISSGPPLPMVWNHLAISGEEMTGTWAESAGCQHLPPPPPPDYKTENRGPVNKVTET